MFYKNVATQCFQIIKGAKVKGISGKSHFASPTPQFAPQFSTIADEPPDQTFSLYNVRKVVKASSRPFDEGYTSIRSECPACDLKTSQGCPSVFINKTTGENLLP